VPVLAWLALYAATEPRLRRRYEVPASALRLPPPGPQALDRGARLGRGIAPCGFCHGDDLGGRVVADTLLLGRLWAPNLTRGRGGILHDYSDADFVRAVRFGLDRQGRTLALMPSDHLRMLGDHDLSALLAWLRSLPPVDHEVPPRRFGVFTRLTLALGLAPELLVAERIPPATNAAPPPSRAPDAHYGAWLVQVGLCQVCHGQDLAGGLHPLAAADEPVPPDLRRGGALEGWSEADFRLAMRAGVTPDGRTLDPAFMPWPHFALLGDVELAALWSYLRAPSARSTPRASS